MTTPEPRVRVSRPYVWAKGQFVGPNVYSVECAGCGYRPTWRGCCYAPIDTANQAAADHAATCPALRLARLIRELEALRDSWLQQAPYGSVALDRALTSFADDLDAILARATGATGC